MVLFNLVGIGKCYLKPINLFILLFITLSLYASNKTEILLLHSYSQEYSWTKKQHNSFVKKLNSSNKKFNFSTEYLDTKRLKLTDKYQKDFINYLSMKYVDVEFDLVYVTDDNALNFISSNYNKILDSKRQVPVFFSGINNLEISDVLPKSRFVGIYEIKEVKPNIELIKQFSPQTRNIYFLGDDSNTYSSIKKTIESNQKDFPNLNFKYISDEYISNIKKNLPSKPRSFVVLTTIGNLKDDNNKTLLPNESIEMIKENKNLILLTMEDTYMYEGVVGGYVTSGQIQGTEAARLVLNYLKDGTLKNTNSLKNSSAYHFNSKDITASRIVLSEYIARDAKILDKDNSSIVNRKSLMLNLFTIVLILLLMTFFIVFAVKTKKCNRLFQKLKYLQSIKSKLDAKNQLLNNILSFNNIGYWKLNLRDDDIYVSQELLNIFDIDSDLYKDDSEFISYFIHSSDKKLYDNNLNYVKESGKSIVFKHRFISSDKTIFNVTHKIYTEYNQHTASSIVGIVKVD
jgi:hypothetical protein